MRLIDADPLKAAFDFDPDDEIRCDVIHYGIDHAPTIDAEPVVRCKDCRKNPKISMVGCPMAGLNTWTEDGFCFMGEKVSE